MNQPGPELLVRFYGRFVFAESASAPGELRVLAINPRANTEVPAGFHHAFLTLSEEQMTTPLSPATGRKATYRIMANVEPVHASHLLWTLEQHQLDIPGSGGVEWAPGARDKVADLGMLAAGRKVKPQHLRQVGGPVTAIISLREGIATSYQITPMPLEYQYVKFGDPGSKVKDAGQLADMVQVQLPFPAAGLVLTTTDAAGHTSTISIPTPIAPPPVPPVIVTFSNVCSTSHEGADLEFAGFYEILDSAPALQERLVPGMAALGTRPFGDCFLASRVTY